MAKSSETATAMCYPHERQYDDWKDHAEEMGYGSISQWIQDMVEAGAKKFDASVTHDESVEEIREQRNDLKQELDQARDRISTLESQVYDGEKALIEEFLRENPGAEFGEIVQHVINTAPVQTREHIEAMKGDVVVVDDDRYYLTEER